jgi:hypothetical protein
MLSLRLLLRKGCRRAAGLVDDRTQNIVPQNRPVPAAVNGVVAIVAQEEILVFAAQDHLFGMPGLAERGSPRDQVSLIEFAPVEIDAPVLQVDRISRGGDDSFDREAVVNGVAQDHYVAVVRLPEAIDPTVQKVALRILESWDHAAPHDPDRLNEEVADKEVAACSEGSEHQKLKDLSEDGAPQ